MICRAINNAWALSLRSSERRFVRALHAPRQAQLAVLQDVLQSQAGTAFFRDHRLDTRMSLDAFRHAVPLGDYASHRPYIERIRGGEANALTQQRVTHLIPTSGSSGARKLIPHTAGLQRQFDAALGPWVRDLARRYPEAMHGRAYWSVSPAMPEDRNASIPIGFEDDTAYLGPIGRHLVRRLLAVPTSVRHETDQQRFWLRTLTHLVAAHDLSLISVWHPSYMMRLLDELAGQWDAVLEHLSARRRKQLRGLGPSDIRGIWPGLALVSAWADASASLAFDRMTQRIDGVATQPKGLLASECWTTIPYASAYPLAVNAHFFEFIDDAGQVLLCDEITPGETYATAVTTAGGLYRYRTGDRVRITGHLHQTPTLAFIGRGQDVSDLCGEKLNEHHATQCLRAIYEQLGYAPKDQVLGSATAHAPTHYRLIVFSDCPPPSELAEALDQQLKTNPHYELARRLGQLGPIEVAWSSAARRPAMNASQHTPLGAHKPAALISTEQMQALDRHTKTPV